MLVFLGVLISKNIFWKLRVEAEVPISVSTIIGIIGWPNYTTPTKPKAVFLVFAASRGWPRSMPHCYSSIFGLKKSAVLEATIAVPSVATINHFSMDSAQFLLGVIHMQYIHIYIYTCIYIYTYYHI